MKGRKNKKQLREIHKNHPPYLKHAIVFNLHYKLNIIGIKKNTCLK
jgi:hypothetical protein